MMLGIVGTIVSRYCGSAIHCDPGDAGIVTFGITALRIEIAGIDLHCSCCKEIASTCAIVIGIVLVRER